MRLLSLPLASLLLAGQHHLPSVPRQLLARHLQLLPHPRQLLTRLSSSTTSSSSPPPSFTVATPPPPPHTLEIKKSRFVAHLVPFEAHAGFLELQQRLKTEHPKASHVCYAYLGPGGVERSSDDGEPGGTAGAPILTALKRDPELKNAGCLVVRYFGGTKLGAGGLIRAYAQACREGMAAAREGGFLVEKVERVELLVTVDAASVGVVYKAAQVGSGVVEDEEYLDTGEVRLKLSLVAEEVGRVERVLKDGIAGGVLRWGGGRESR